MKQTAAIALISIGIMISLGIAGYFFIQHESSKGEKERATDAPVTAQANAEKLNGIGVIDTSSSQHMNEARLQTYLHEMTHSKVFAEEKWGEARPMSQQNIDSLLADVEASDYELKAYYLRTLEEWKEGDFSNAVEVHNKFWHMRNGSVGEAIRLMTDEEEQAYIQANF